MGPAPLDAAATGSEPLIDAATESTEAIAAARRAWRLMPWTRTCASTFELSVRARTDRYRCIEYPLSLCLGRVVAGGRLRSAQHTVGLPGFEHRRYRDATPIREASCGP